MAIRDGQGLVRHCTFCAEVVGVYEPAVFVLGDGSVVVGSPLTVQHAGEIVLAYHRGCSPAPAGEA